MPLLLIMQRQRMHLSPSHLAKLNYIQMEFGFSTNTRNLEVLTRYHRILEDLEFLNPQYNAAIRVMLDKKIREGLKNQKARLQSVGNTCTLISSAKFRATLLYPFFPSEARLTLVLFQTIVSSILQPTQSLHFASQP